MSLSVSKEFEAYPSGYSNWFDLIYNLNYSTFKLAEAYKENGMAAYSELQQKEFGAEKDGYSATKHQREVGVSYYDAVSNAVTKGQSATTAMDDSTETDQF